MPFLCNRTQRLSSALEITLVSIYLAIYLYVYIIYIKNKGDFHHGEAETILTSIHEVAGLIPGLAR